MNYTWELCGDTHGHLRSLYNEAGNISFQQGWYRGTKLRPFFEGWSFYYDYFYFTTGGKINVGGKKFV